jgi:hypothetical protein
MTHPRKIRDLVQDDIITLPMDACEINMLRWKSISSKIGNLEFRVKKVLDNSIKMNYTLDDGNANTNACDDQEMILRRRETQTKRYKKVGK